MITSNKALEAIKASEEIAKKLGITITTTVVDEHGSIVAVKRMDGAFVVSPQISYTKAYTSATLGFPTAALAAFTAPGKPFYGLENMKGGKFTSIDGGIPVKSGDKVIGAVGVGGSIDVSQDDQCAKAAAAVLV
jgi:uncharacterized protein GlcG (DUF336 family)